MKKTILGLLSFVLVGLFFSSCNNHTQKTNKDEKTQSQESSKKQNIILETDNLIIEKLSNNVYLHISYINTDDFGRVKCNGLLVISNSEGVVLDTPTNDIASKDLLDFVSNQLNVKIKAVVPTHFHEDCIGGIKTFEEKNIPLILSKVTDSILKDNGISFQKKADVFSDTFNLKFGNSLVRLGFYGEGHTKDNIIGYFPYEDVIFGGCLIKPTGASKGYLGDANINEWSKTVAKIKREYPNVKTIIPGHGKWGGTELLDYTIHLFNKE